MPYKAKKRCNFGGVSYSIDDLIPDEVVDQKAVDRLSRTGYIEYMPVGTPKTPVSPPNGNGNTNTPPALDGDEIRRIIAEFTNDKLMSRKRDDLVELASTLEVAIAPEATKQEITNVLLDFAAKQAESENTPPALDGDEIKSPEGAGDDATDNEAGDGNQEEDDGESDGDA